MFKLNQIIKPILLSSILVMLTIFSVKAADIKYLGIDDYYDVTIPATTKPWEPQLGDSEDMKDYRASPKFHVKMEKEQINQICAALEPYALSVTKNSYILYKHWYKGKMVNSEKEIDMNKFTKYQQILVAGSFLGEEGDTVYVNLNGKDIEYGEGPEQIFTPVMYKYSGNPNSGIWLQFNNSYITYIVLMRQLKEQLYIHTARFKGKDGFLIYDNIAELNKCLSLKDKIQEWNREDKQNNK